MQRDQAQHEVLADLLVVARGLAHHGVGDKTGERPGKGDFVVAQQARAHLRAQHGQQRKHRQRPQRAVPGAVLGVGVAAQVAHQPGG